MYIILGIGVSNKAVIDKLQELKKEFIVACKEEEISEAISYSFNVITYDKLKYLDLDKIKYAIKSPGIPYYNKHIRYLKSKHVKVINEIELTYILTNKKGKYIGVSGSVVKVSVVSLLFELVKAKTSNVILAGNIGIPLISYLNEINEETIIILEVSSFQLDDFVRIKLNIALLLNIYDNHLDFYKKRQKYYQSKFRLTNNQSNKDYFIVNLNDKITRKELLSHSYNSRLIDYKNGFTSKHNCLYYYGVKMLNLCDYRLKGEHNLDNLKAIITILKILKISLDSKVIQKFEPLKYHLEEKNYSNFKMINDSKSTSTSSLKSAIETYKNNSIILLFGGYNKNLDFSFLKKYTFKKIICFGKLSYTIGNTLYVDKCFSKLKQACEYALNIASQNDLILFSPGCASFDEFENYIERGEKFNEYIERCLNE